MRGDMTYLRPGTPRGYHEEHFPGAGTSGKDKPRKTEEEIVLEYVKKQTLLEAQHQRKEKGRVVMDDEDEEFQRAIKLSMQVY